MNKGGALKIIAGTIPLCAIATCTKRTPSQVTCRFGDNRYLELIGYDCEGYVIYHDIRRRTQKSIYGNPIYRVFSSEFIHPSEQYILVPEWESGAYKISRDYGQTWQVAKHMASFPVLERSLNGTMRDSPEGKETKRVVMINNQAFVSTAQGHLHINSYPFDDPHLTPGGPGIDYQYFDDTYYLYRPGEHRSSGEYVNGHMKPESPGHVWETVVFMKASLTHLAEDCKTSYRSLPDKEPEAVDRKGWTRMYRDTGAGKQHERYNQVKRSTGKWRICR